MVAEIRSRFERQRLRFLGWSGAHLLADARAFLQERLALFFRLVFAIMAGFYAIGFVVAVTHGGDLGEFMRSLPHLALIMAVFGLVVLLERRPLGLVPLRILEVLVIVAISVAFCAVLYIKPARDLADSALLMVVGLMLVGRAALVPSVTERLVGSGVVAYLLVVWTFHDVYDRQPDVMHPWAGPIPQPLAGFVFALAWGISFVLAAAVIGRVIYGLQAEVRERQQLGQYTLDERLGEGGMGVVYRARHAMLRRPTAVKLLPPDKLGEQSVRRFEREVQQTALLEHPNTITIFDYGRTPDGIFYYAMEYLEGIDLERLVARWGAQPAERVVPILRQVASALAEAHDAGLIHRDVKPANIYLCRYGGMHDVAKVLDFGLVKERAPEEDLALSRADTVTGTPLYMAPEAISAPESLDGRADLYALAAVGYFLVSGRHVFEGKNLVEVLGHHLHTTPVPPSERLGPEGSIPLGLEEFLLRALAKSPDDRPGDARAFVAELDALGLRTWDEAAAAEWWETHAEALAADQARRESSVSQAATLDVALLDRG